MSGSVTLPPHAGWKALPVTLSNPSVSRPSGLTPVATCCHPSLLYSLTFTLTVRLTLTCCRPSVLSDGPAMSVLCEMPRAHMGVHDRAH